MVRHISAHPALLPLLLDTSNGPSLDLLLLRLADLATVFLKCFDQSKNPDASPSTMDLNEMKKNALSFDAVPIGLGGGSVKPPIVGSLAFGGNPYFAAPSSVPTVEVSTTKSALSLSANTLASLIIDTHVFLCRHVVRGRSSSPGSHDTTMDDTMPIAQVYHPQDHIFKKKKKKKKKNLICDMTVLMLWIGFGIVTL